MNYELRKKEEFKNNLLGFTKTHYSLFIIHYSKYILLALVIVLSLFVTSSASAGTIIKAPAYLGLNQGLVGCWPLDGIYTNAPDCSGYNKVGTLLAGPTKVQGKVGQALKFNSGITNDLVDAGILDSSLYGTNAKTFSFWFNASSFSTTADQRLMKVATGGVGANLEIWAEDNGVSVAFNGHRIIFAKNLLSLNRWYHFALVVPANSTSADVFGYIDGVSQPLATETGSAVSINTDGAGLFRFGGGNNEDFNGMMDEVRAYNRALSTTEIQRLYLIGLGSKENKSITSSNGDLLTKGLAGCWSFDGLYTKAPDCSGNNNTGTLTNGPTKVQGKVGQALNFDGVNDSVEGSANMPLPITVNAIFKYRVSGDHQVIFANNSGANDGYRVKINTSNQVSFTLGGVADYDFTNLTVTEGLWYYLSLVVTGNGGTATGYLTPLGGTISSQALSIGTMSGSLSSFQIGTTTGLGDFFKGTLDEVRVYNRVLSVEEIQRLYNQTQSKFNSPQTDSLTHGLVGCWTFDGLYTKAPDCSGNNNTGTLTNGPRKVQGKVGQALNFDGVNDWVNLGTGLNTVRNVSQVSASAWVKWNSIAASAIGMLSFSVNAGGGSSRFVMEKEANGVTCGGRAPDSDGLDIVTTTTSPFTIGIWYHIVCVVDYANDTAAVYINGIVQATSGTIAFTNTSTDNTTSGNASIGSADDGSGGFANGQIDEVRIYNRALSAGEVQKLYNMGR